MYIWIYTYIHTLYIYMHKHTYAEITFSSRNAEDTKGIHHFTK